GAARIDPRGRPCAAEGGRDRGQCRRQEGGRRPHRRSLRHRRELTLASLQRGFRRNGINASGKLGPLPLPLAGEGTMWRPPSKFDQRWFDISGKRTSGSARKLTGIIALEGCAVSLVSMTAGVEQAELSQAAPKAASARVLRPALGLLLPVALAVFWEIAVRMGLSNGRLVPPPSVIWNTFADLAATGELQQHALATIWRVWWGFVFGVIGGTILGAIAGYSALTYRLVDPTLQGLRAVPSIAWVPLFILWFGIFEASKIILIAVGVFFPV